MLSGDYSDAGDDNTEGKELKDCDEEEHQSSGDFDESGESIKYGSGSEEDAEEDVEE